MDSLEQQPQPSEPSHTTEGANAAIARISSAELLQGQQQLEIEHSGEVYRLRLTRTGKLILTK